MKLLTMLDNIANDTILLILLGFLIICIIIIIILSLCLYKEKRRNKEHHHSNYNHKQDLSNENNKKNTHDKNINHRDKQTDQCAKENLDKDLSHEDLAEDDVSHVVGLHQLSKKDLHRQQQKEERARKRDEELRRKELLEAERKRKAFNPKLSKPENVKYISLTVSDGHLVQCEIGKTPYYRAWKYDVAIYYEFYCEPSRIPKAFNNHSAIIDPFCIKDADSVSFEQTKSMTTIEYGKMDANYNILNKSIIKYE